jgi:ribulose-phosphate 3-epimerase
LWATAQAPIVKSLRRHNSAFLDVHLMVSNPAQWVADFAAAGASMYTFHLEAALEAGDGRGGETAVRQLIAAVKAAGMLCGMTINPGTPVEQLVPYLDELDMVLIMTVQPGFGGQSFQPEMMQKVSQ